MASGRPEPQLQVPRSFCDDEPVRTPVKARPDEEIPSSSPRVSPLKLNLGGVVPRRISFSQSLNTQLNENRDTQLKPTESTIATVSDLEGTGANMEADLATNLADLNTSLGLEPNLASNLDITHSDASIPSSQWWEHDSLRVVDHTVVDHTDVISLTASEVSDTEESDCNSADMIADSLQSSQEHPKYALRELLTDSLIDSLPLPSRQKALYTSIYRKLEQHDPVGYSDGA